MGILRKYYKPDGCPCKIEVGPAWEMYPIEMIFAEIWNGVGSKDQPEWLKEFLGKLPYMEFASLSHDVDYQYGGTSRDRLKADRRFRRNCFRLAKAEIGPWYKRWFTSRRIQWLAAVVLILGAYRTLRLFGRSAWTNTEHEDPTVERTI